MIYDTTDSAPPLFHPPTLLRVALGPSPISPPNGVDGSFWAVDVKTYAPESELEEAKSFAFVADVLGRVQVFDVSPSRLFTPALTLPYLPYPAPSQPNPILTPLHKIEFDAEPADGLRPNCIDLEIDGDYAYVTLGRGGIAVIDVSANPLHTAPTIHEVIDTPGITMGLTFRRVSGVATHLVVGDSRAGMRLYRRGP